MLEEKSPLPEKFDLLDRFVVGGLLDLGCGFDFFLRFRLWFLLLQTNLIFPYKCTEFRIVILLAV
jgi:hypothetical protein